MYGFMMSNITFLINNCQKIIKNILNGVEMIEFILSIIISFVFAIYIIAKKKDKKKTMKIFGFIFGFCVLAFYTVLLCICLTNKLDKKCDIMIEGYIPVKVNCHNGSCVDLNSTYRCDCNEGFTGSFCETKIEGCSAKPCINGVCIQSFLGFSCECLRGCKGPLCDEKVNLCDPNPCSNRGVCHDGYVCECRINYGKLW